MAFFVKNAFMLQYESKKKSTKPKQAQKRGKL